MSAPPLVEGDTFTRPDPSKLTTEQLVREMSWLEKFLTTRIDALDRMLEQMQAERDLYPSRIDEKIKAVSEVNRERFASITERFTERDTRHEQATRDAKTAVDAALQAAKEAVGKSEASTTKQIDAQGVNIQTATQSIKQQIDDLKARLGAIEGSGLGRESARTSGQASGHLAIAIIGTAIGLGGFAISIVVLLR